MEGRLRQAAPVALARKSLAKYSDLQHLAGRAREQVLVDKVVEGAVENCLRIAGFVLGSVIFDQLVGVQDVAADLAAEVGLLGLPALLGELALALLLGLLGQA